MQDVKENRTTCEVVCTRVRGHICQHLTFEQMCIAETVGEWFIARQYSSLGEGAAVVSLGAVDMEEGVQVRVQLG